RDHRLGRHAPGQAGLELRRLPVGVRTPSRVWRRKAAEMLRVAVDAYGWTSGGLVDAMLTTVRTFVEINPEFRDWGLPELEHLERNADLFRKPATSCVTDRSYLLILGCHARRSRPPASPDPAHIPRGACRIVPRPPP